MFLTEQIASMQNEMYARGVDPDLVEILANTLGDCSMRGMHRGPITIDYPGNSSPIGLASVNVAIAAPFAVNAPTFSVPAALNVRNALGEFDEDNTNINMGIALGVEGLLRIMPVEPPGPELIHLIGRPDAITQVTDGGPGPAGGILMVDSPFYVLQGDTIVAIINPATPQVTFYDSTGTKVWELLPDSGTLTLDNGTSLTIACGGGLTIECATGTPGQLIVNNGANSGPLFTVDPSTDTVTVNGADVSLNNDSGTPGVVYDPTAETLTLGNATDLIIDCGGGITIQCATGTPGQLIVNNGANSGPLFTVDPSTDTVTVNGTNSDTVIDPEAQTITITGDSTIVVDASSGVVTVDGTELTQAGNANTVSYRKYASNDLVLNGTSAIALDTEDSGAINGSWTATTDGVQLPATGIYRVYAQTVLKIVGNISDGVSVVLGIYVAGVLAAKFAAVQRNWDDADNLLYIGGSTLISGNAGDEILFKEVQLREVGGGSDIGEVQWAGGSENTYMIIERIS